MVQIGAVNTEMSGGGSFHQRRQRRRVSTAAPYSSVVARRSGIPKHVVATVYGFQRFRGQIKAEVKGFSPSGIPQHVVVA
jgi:hypothetical protein